MTFNRALVICFIVPAVLVAVWFEFLTFLTMARVAARDEISEAKRAWRQS